MVLDIGFTFSKFKAKASKGGTTSKVKIAEVDNPPKTTVPIPRYNSEPEPGKLQVELNQTNLSKLT